ncbi:MAG: hypothetical protein ACK4ND_05845 [Cytophagaceae bacterium]
MNISLNEELKEVENLIKEIAILGGKHNIPINNFFEEVQFLNIYLTGLKFEIDMCRGNIKFSELEEFRLKRKDISELLNRLKEKLLKFEKGIPK